MRKLIVNKKFDNKRINKFIMDSFPNLNINTYYKSLRKKDIRVNNVRINDNVIIHENDEITLYISDEFLLGNFTNLSVIYEDENILIINKPENISITQNSSSAIDLTNIVKKQFGNSLEPCHRLDQNTTGLILYAKNSESLNILLKKFKDHEIQKYYKTTVLGTFKKKHDILEAYLFKDNKKSFVYISDEFKKGYVKIITEYTVISENKEKNISELDVCLHTGKTHQIRAHLAHIGHPIIGDGKYGINEINKKFKKSTQMLSSYKLKFNFKTSSGILEYLNRKEFKLD